MFFCVRLREGAGLQRRDHQDRREGEGAVRRGGEAGNVRLRPLTPHPQCTSELIWLLIFFESVSSHVSIQCSEGFKGSQWSECVVKRVFV